MKKTFVAKLGAQGNGALFEIPFDVKATFGKARAPVLCTLNGKTSWRTTVAVYGGKSLIGVRKELRDAAGLKAGDSVKVTLEADLAPRVVTAPADLKKALGKKKAAWDKLSFTHQNEWVKALEEAKKPETRARRLAQLLAALG